MVAYTEYSTDARIRREAETLASLSGFDVRLLSLREGPAPREYEKNGVVIHELPIAKYQGKKSTRYILSYVRFMLLAFFKINQLLLRGALDLVHVHNMPDFLVFSAIVPRLVGKKLVLDVHDTILETFKVKFGWGGNGLLPSVLRLEERVSFAIAHRITCVNDVQREALLRRGVPPAKTYVSMNVPDPNLFNGVKEAFATKDHNRGSFRVVYHATISKRLSLDVAIRAVVSLRSQIQGLEFHIVGSGDDLEEFERLTRELGAEEMVIFAGNRSLDEIPGILSEMDVGVVPNDRNPATELMLPVKMMECIALGIPVVVPRLRAIQHYFSDDMVTYYEAGDPVSLSQALLELYQAPEKRHRKKKNALRFLDTYGWQRQKLDFIEFYNRLVN